MSQKTGCNIFRNYKQHSGEGGGGLKAASTCNNGVLCIRCWGTMHTTFGLQRLFFHISDSQLQVQCRISQLWSNSKKVKQSHYRPGQAHRVPGGRGSQISIQLAHEGGKIVSRMHRSPLPPRKYSWYSFLLAAESTPGPYCDRKNYRQCNGLCWKMDSNILSLMTSPNLILTTSFETCYSFTELFLLHWEYSEVSSDKMEARIAKHCQHKNFVFCGLTRK
jgi:hypothetical protein